MKRFALVLLITLGGCDSAPDLSGFYRTTSLVVDPSGCGPGQADTNAPMYFQIKSEEFAGFTFLTMHGCTQPNEGSCNSSIPNSVALTTGISDGYKGEIYVSSGSPQACSLSYSVGTATLKDNILRFESKSFRQTNQMVTKCETDEAKKRGTTMPCAGVTTLLGQPFSTSTQ
jgi:hypothetical protein